uniref:Choice-of-anchor I domain-containing protein n=1 Tax=Branchiostoma floridae TaxID=7739 RepID=C3YVF6_BRAFL|eukprot:XP_002599667.1 hypothetical protein BRAFLDRAFT_119372 [Branchiostoma floridae]
MSRRRGRRGHRRSRARPVAPPPAFVKTVDHAFDPLVGQRRISLFKSVVITSLFLLAMTTVVVVSIAIDVSTNITAGEPANLPPYGAWEDDHGPKPEENTPAHQIPDGMTPTDASSTTDPATEQLRKVLWVRYRVAVIHGETEMYKILYKYLVDSPHTQIPTVRPGYGEPSGFEAWDYLTTGENHAFNSPIRTRRRVGKPWSDSHHENDPDSLESKRRSDTEDDNRYDVTDYDLKTGDYEYNYKHPRVRDLIAKVISDSEILDAIVARHHTDEMPINPAEDQLAPSKDMTTDKTSAFNVPPATNVTQLDNDVNNTDTAASVARHLSEVPITPTKDKLARSKNMAPHSDATNIPDAIVAHNHTDEVLITPTDDKLARSKHMTPDETSAFNAPPATKTTQFYNTQVPNAPGEDEVLARSKNMAPHDETSAFNAPPAANVTQLNDDVNNTDTAAETEEVPQENGTDLSLYPSPEVVMPIVVVGALVTGCLTFSITDGLDPSDPHKVRELHTFGGRGASIFAAEDLSLVWDSGDDFERVGAQVHPAVFNSKFNGENMDETPEDSFDKSSCVKGSEPQALTVGRIGDQTVIFVGNERTSEVVMYSLRDGEAFVPKLESVYRGGRTDLTWTEAYQARDVGDIDPEDIKFIPSDRSPNGRPLLLVDGTVSGTVSVYEVMDNSETSAACCFTSTPAVVLWILMFYASIFNKAVLHEALQERDRYWQDKLHSVEEKNAQLNQLTVEQFNKAAEEVEAKFIKQHYKPVCQDLQEAVMTCYIENPKQTLNCAQQTKAFTNCVENARLHSLRSGLGHQA